MNSNGNGKWDNEVIGVGKTSLSVIPGEKEDALIIEINSPVGEGEGSGDDSALMRPFRKILRDGQKAGKITYVFHKDQNKYYVLGAFCVTNKYMIFFPGFPDRKVMTFGENTYYKKGDVLNIDHFTLELNLKSWHITFDEKRTRNARFPTQFTKQIDKYNYLWLIYRVRSLKYMEPALAKTGIVYHNSRTEIEKKIPMLKDARENGIWKITKLDDDTTEEFFWQFEFFVNTTKELNNYPTVPVLAGGGKGIVIRDKRKQAPIRTVPIEIEDFVGLVYLRISKIFGTLEHPLMFFSGHEANYSVLS